MLGRLRLLFLCYCMGIYTVLTWAKDACDVCLCYKRKSQLHVDCANRGLTEIPSKIPLDTHHLWLQGNSLPDLGGAGTSLGPDTLNVKVLFLHNNPIASVTEDFFNVVPRVHTLMLHHTSLASLPSKYTGDNQGVFSALTRLKWLWINHNDLAALPEDAFSGLTLLRELYAHNNSLTAVPDGLFKDMASMKHLYMHLNALPKADMSCCKLCGLPEPVNVRWGSFAQDERQRCGYDAAVTCSLPDGSGGFTSATCYDPAVKGKTYIFSAAGRAWDSAWGLGLAAALALLTSLSLMLF